jgi:hypothetical protein
MNETERAAQDWAELMGEELAGELRKLGQATADIRAPCHLTDAVMARVGTVELKAPDGFTDALMARIHSEDASRWGGTLEGIRTSGIAAIAVAMVAAAVALVGAFSFEDGLDAEILATFELVEPGE